MEEGKGRAKEEGRKEGREGGKRKCGMKQRRERKCVLESLVLLSEILILINILLLFFYREWKKRG